MNQALQVQPLEGFPFCSCSGDSIFWFVPHFPTQSQGSPGHSRDTNNNKNLSVQKTRSPDNHLHAQSPFNNITNNKRIHLRHHRRLKHICAALTRTGTMSNCLTWPWWRGFWNPKMCWLLSSFPVTRDNNIIGLWTPWNDCLARFWLFSTWISQVEWLPFLGTPPNLWRAAKLKPIHY